MLQIQSLYFINSHFWRCSQSGFYSTIELVVFRVFWILCLYFVIYLCALRLKGKRFYPKSISLLYSNKKQLQTSIFVILSFDAIYLEFYVKRYLHR